MASSVTPRFELDEAVDSTPAERPALGPAMRRLLMPLASLKVTVVLFALAIFIVFAGTMAQTQHDIWHVVHTYFRTSVAWIDFQVFFPKSFFPNLPAIPGSFPFPGGWLIGFAMAVNLLAAHAVRFTYQARGARLMTGLGVIGVGVLVTGLVIAGGSNDGLQGVPFFEWSTLWTVCKLGLAALAGAAVWRGAQLDGARLLERRAHFGTSAVLGALAAWLFIEGDSVALGDSSMRILWQLIQGTLAGGVLLLGCWLVFNKRAGIVLLHAGIGLMMLSELLVGTTAVEGQLHVREGDVVNYVQDIREVELAVVDRSDSQSDKVVVVPQSRLDEGTRLLEHGFLPRWFVEWFPVSLRRTMGCTATEPVVAAEELPFDVHVVRYLQNADLRMLKSGDENPATTGLGKQMFAEEAAPSVGASSSNKVDDTAVYVDFRTKGTDESLGTYLFSVLQSRFQDSRERSGLTDAEVQSSTGPFVFNLSEPAVVEVEGKPYHVALRFKRMYKPYTMKLINVNTEYYPGTTTPRDYSSVLRLTDPERDVDRDVKIWMNNPLRFAGETFYQSNVGADPITNAETTGLQVVTNSGWMIPYVSCMIVGVGMLFQFGQTLLRFLRRRDAAEQLTGWGKATIAAVPDLGAAAMAAGATLGKERELRHAARTERRGDRARQASGDTEPPFEMETRSRWSGYLLPLGFVVFCAIYVFSHARPPKLPADGMDLYAAGKLPLLDHGRAKPIDTLARNTLQVVSGSETFVAPMEGELLKKNWDKVAQRVRKQWKALADEDLSRLADDPQPIEALTQFIKSKTNASREEIDEFLYLAAAERNSMGRPKRQPALRWLFDVAAGRKAAMKHRVFRIDNLEVLDMLGLDRRQGFLYSMAELGARTEKFYEEVEKAHKKPVGELSVYERKLLDLDRRVRTFTAVARPFQHEEFPSDVSQKEREAARGQRAAIESQLAAREKEIQKGNPPLIVPVRTEGAGAKFEWMPYASALTRDFFEAKVLGERPPDPAVAGWVAILAAYKAGNADDFNRAVRKYQSLMADEAPADLNAGRQSYEVFFNQFAPFFQAWILYIGAFVISVLAWLITGWSPALRRTAFWLTVFTLALHTFALASRIYISGRPPVTNLYSSAVFIGWGCVLLGLVLELVFKLGIGNAISAIAGFATLFISFKLAGDGDTFTVMQAVLDTQFWLATHVTCITLGYATTFLSGLLGAFYVLRGVFAPTLNSDVGKSLARMIYGTLCFAIFFSFVGTVLGGLWADDSWGRFWGWDPKENGALMIVLWNALVLHARWDGMVKDRGMAVLAVGGNIVTAWSWFGVNELGVGLHSYGFTEGVLLSLGLFVLSQLAIIAVGIRPKAYWWSQRAEPV